MLGFLESCNERRSAHGAKPLTEDPEMSRGAESWARHLLSQRRLKHSTTSHGENIWAKMGGADATLTGRLTAATAPRRAPSWSYFPTRGLGRPDLEVPDALWQAVPKIKGHNALQVFDS